MSSTTLVLFAVWEIGQRMMRAMHTLLTCWDYHARPESDGPLLLRDPVMWNILTMSVPLRRIFPPLFRRSRDLERLREFRHRKARERQSELVWDKRLGALLAPDEMDFLYGTSTTSSDSQ